MLELKRTSEFKKDLKRVTKRGLPVHLLNDIIVLLREEMPLAPKHKDHALKGDYAGFRECHIIPDWLLIYAVDEGKLILTASRTGSHADLF
jgi:mRNA interferase YafQ